MNQDIIINETDDDGDSRIPSDIEAFMSENGIGDRYQCLLKMIVNGEGIVQSQYNNAYPTIPDVGKQFGPGKYEWCFSWSSEVPDGSRKKKRMLVYSHTLGESFREAHEDWLFEQAEIRERKRTEKLKRRKEEAELRQAENGGRPVPNDSGASAADMLEKSFGYAERMMVLSGQKAPVPQGNGNDSVILMMTKSMELVMTMMMAQQKSSMDLVLALLAQRNTPQPGADDMFEKLFNLADRMTTIKRDMEPEEKETLAEKIFGFLMQMGPTVLEMLAKSAEERAANPLLQKAMNRPEMEAMRNDPEALAMLVNRLDPVWGTAKVDELLKTARMQRPASTRGNYAKYAGWPRARPAAPAAGRPVNGHARPAPAAPQGARPATATAPQAPQEGPGNPFTAVDEDEDEDD